MKATLIWINVLKEVFRNVMAANIEFNFPKLYVITHYLMMIRKFSSIDDYNIAMFKVYHKYSIKA